VMALRVSQQSDGVREAGVNPTATIMFRCHFARIMMLMYDTS
jgi:hypothetical protein